MRTIAIALLALAFVGCAKQKLSVHYEHIATCRTWNDQDDGTEFVYNRPLFIFRIKSVANVSEPNVPDTKLDVHNIYYPSDEKNFPEPTGIASFVPWNVTLGPGQKVKYPNANHGGLFAIQMFDQTPPDPALVPTLKPYLYYKNGDDQNVQMFKDPSTPKYHEFCGRTALLAIE